VVAGSSPVALAARTPAILPAFSWERRSSTGQAFLYAEDAMRSRLAAGAALAWFVIAVGIVQGQQPNSPQAGLLVNGANGPPFPVSAAVPAGSSATVQVTGTPNAPFALFGSATGLVSAGSGVFPGGIVDLPLTPPPGVVFDGFQNPSFNTGSSGSFTMFVSVPLPGVPPAGVPLGPVAALQAVVADATVPGGLRASAATQAIVTQVPVTVPLALGLNSTTTVNLAALGVTVPFYGVSYSAMNVDSNGYITFGAPIASQATSSQYNFNPGPPKIAACWTNVAPNVAGAVNLTTGTTPTGVPFARVDWVGVPNVALGPPPTFTFAASIDATGFIKIDHTLMTAASAFETSVGITPGGGSNTPTFKNLAGIVGGGGYMGAVNESFHGYYGNLTMPYYLGLAPNPYNLFGLTLHFQPIGSGPLPGATNRYFLY
jgi:hypothetical protein